MAQRLALSLHSKRRSPVPSLCGTCKLSLCLQWILRVPWLPTGQKCAGAAAAGTQKTSSNSNVFFWLYFGRWFIPLNWNRKFSLSFLFFKTLWTVFCHPWMWVMADSYSLLPCQAPCPLSALLRCCNRLSSLSHRRTTPPCSSTIFKVTQGLVSVHPCQPFILS